MALGIDVSEHNGAINWLEVKDAGVEFAIIRLGYGHQHLDGMFYENICGALGVGLKIGVYYYSYALDEAGAKGEGEYLVEVLKDCGIQPETLKMGVWFDMEDADGYKARHGMPDNQTITNMCSEFICECNRNGYACGIYASYDWLVYKIYTEQLADYVPYWCAQWSRNCDWDKATLWQYTNCLEIGGNWFDGNFSF